MSVPSPALAEVRAIYEAAWRPEGYTAPNLTTYPWQWLWDSCFHAIVWAELGDDDRAVRELTHVFRTQTPDGFVPHIDYERDPGALAGFWGRRGSSSITQPPVYGHTVAALARRGVEVPAAVGEAARAGLAFLLDQRARTDAGLVAIVHPWESGCDDSPRWDGWGAAEPERWYEAKGNLLAAVVRNEHGSPVGSPAFEVGSAGFNAITAFAARELATALRDRPLAAAADELAAALAAQWDDDLVTWVDDGPKPSGRCRTLDALLPVLVDRDRRPAVRAALGDAGAYAGEFGLRGVHRAEPVYEPARYWRGGCWAPLAYLLSRAVPDVAAPMVLGARTSGWAEYWDADSGAGYGAVPQSWTGLAVALG